MRELGPIWFPTGSYLGQSAGRTAGLPMQKNDSDCSSMAQHALVLGSRGHVKPDPLVLAQCVQSVNTALQPDSSPESVKPKSRCLAPRASAIKNKAFLRQWQHELRLLKDAQPGQCMRQSGPFLQSCATVFWLMSGHHLLNP